MSKMAWVIVLLLIGVNAVWLLVSNSDENESPPTVPTVTSPPAQPQPANPDPVPDEPDPPQPEQPDPPRPEQPKAPNDARKAWVGSQPWYEGVWQSGDPEARERALDEIRAALESDDSLQQLTAVTALARVAMTHIEFDGKRLRKPLVAVLSTAQDPDLIQKALRGLHHADPQPDDLDRVIAMLEGSQDARLRSRLAPLVAEVADHQVTGKAAGATLKLLSDQSPLVLKPTLSSLEGATVSQEVEARLLELAQDPMYRLYTVRFALARLRTKSQPVVTELLGAVRGDDPKLHRWAVRGLREGVIPDAARPSVVAASLELFRASTNPIVRTDCLRTIGAMGDASVLPELKKLTEDPTLSDALRGELGSLVEQLAPPSKKDGG